MKTTREQLERERDWAQGQVEGVKAIVDDLKAQLAAAEQRALDGARLLLEAGVEIHTLRTASKAAETALEMYAETCGSCDGRGHITLSDGGRYECDDCAEARAALTQLRAATAAGGGHG